MIAFPVALTLCACVAAPQTAAPTVMAVPGDGKTTAQFQQDDMSCRQYAQSLIGNKSPAQAAQESQVNSSIVGTLLGAAAGAAIGAAAHNPGAGAAIGAGTGLVAGTAAGSNAAAASAAAYQQRYDSGYAQCMTTAGNKLSTPVARAYPAYPPPPGYYPPPPPPGYYPPPPPPAY